MIASPAAPPIIPELTPDPQLAEALARFLGQSPEPGLLDAIRTHLADRPAGPPPRPGKVRHTATTTCWKCGAGADNPKVYWLWIRDNFSTCFYCGTSPQQPIHM